MLIEPLPAVNKVLSYIQQQERQRQVLSGNSGHDTMALFTWKNNENFKGNTKTSATFKKNKPYCTHYKILGHSLDNCLKASNAEPLVCSPCDMIGHTMERCYKLHGYPPRHQLHNKPKSSGYFSNQADGQHSYEPKKDTDESISLTKEQYQEIMALLHSKDSSTVSLG